MKNWEKMFDEKYERQFKEYNPIVEVSGHYEKSYLHETYPERIESRMDFDGEIVRKHLSATFEENCVEKDAIDKRDKYVTEYQVSFQESIKKFIAKMLIK